MGQDAIWVVGGKLKVYGVEDLPIADGSIMPRVTTGTPWVPASSPANTPQKSSIQAEHTL